MRVSSIEEVNKKYYYEIGVYKLLMPSYEQGYMANFNSDIVGKINQYDKKYNTELLQTSIKYIQSGGNIKQTSKIMNLHSNTVRYRINKVKEILNIDKSEFEFYEELSIGIKLYMIYQNI